MTENSDNCDNKEESKKDNDKTEPTKTDSLSFNKLNTISVLIVIISIGTMGVIGIDECRRCFALKSYPENQKVDTKKYAIYGKSQNSAHLKHVFAVLERLGYERTRAEDGNWDLLWAHDYPFRVLYDSLKNLHEHQKVNHFPGCGYLTNKVDLATSDLKYIPRAFKLPLDREKLMDFAKASPGKSFVIKNNEHRHVKVKRIEEIDLDRNDSFVQEFVDRPLLVGGHMFDIGIYTIVTSIDPLRIYIYNGDVLLRFCPEKYHPFDSENLDKYIVGDDYLPIWQVPELQYHYNVLGFGMRESLSAYLKIKGQDASKIWKQIEQSIRIAVLSKEKAILDIVKRFKSKRNFFEMMRFDFLVDEDLNVFLLEANMSPNLSSAHFKPNQLLYEQVLYNMFGLIGVGQRISTSSLKIRSQSEELMQTADKNIAVAMEICNSEVCRISCEALDCKLCKPCLTSSLKRELVQAHREHLNRGDFKRIFPPSMDTNVEANLKDYSERNKLMHLWFKEKCAIDSTWCH